MSNLEQQLTGLRRRPVPPALDARVARSLQREKPLLARPVPAWVCAAAALVGLAAGALLAGLPGREPRVGETATLLASNGARASDAFPFIGRRFVNPGEE